MAGLDQGCVTTRGTATMCYCAALNSRVASPAGRLALDSPALVPPIPYHTSPAEPPDFSFEIEVQMCAPLIKISHATPHDP